MTAGLYFSRIDGTRGEIWIPSLSILVARLTRPALIRRREGNTPTVGQFDLHAVYSFLNADLLRDDDFTKEWTVFVGKKPLKVTLIEESKIELIEHARALRVERVTVQ